MLPDKHRLTNAQVRDQKIVSARLANDDYLPLIASLLEFAGRRLAPHEAPSSISRLDRLPRSSVAKLLRADLRALTEQAGRQGV